MHDLQTQHTETKGFVKQVIEKIHNINEISEHRPDLRTNEIAFFLDNIVNKTDERLNKAIHGDGSEKEEPFEQLKECQTDVRDIHKDILIRSKKATHDYSPDEKLLFKNRVLKRTLDQLDEMIVSTDIESKKMNLKSIKRIIINEIRKNEYENLNDFVEEQKIFRR
jgi:hypothetical protein